MADLHYAFTMMSKSSDIISTAMRFSNDYADTQFQELCIFSDKNCLSFVLDLFLYIKLEHWLSEPGNC